jgi:hypothetical protein
VAICAYATDILKTSVDCHFTDHSINHSYRMLEIIDRVLEQTRNEPLLNNLEKYKLQAAVFLHDIGMQEELITPMPSERRQKHEFLSVNRIKMDFKRIGIMEDMVDAICDVVLAHRGTFSNKTTITLRTCQTVNIELLQALIYLSDELDITHERVDIKNIGRLNYDIDNYMHFYKHYYTDAVDIGNDRGITIHYRYPKNRKKEYEILLKKLVEDKIKITLDKVRNVLNLRFNMGIFISTPKDIETTSVELIDIDIYQKIVGKILLPHSVSLLKSINFKQMIDCQDPELFYSGDSRWEAIVMI